MKAWKLMRRFVETMVDDDLRGDFARAANEAAIFDMNGAPASELMAIRTSIIEQLDAQASEGILGAPFPFPTTAFVRKSSVIIVRDVSDWRESAECPITPGGSTLDVTGEAYVFGTEAQDNMPVPHYTAAAEWGLRIWPTSVTTRGAVMSTNKKSSRGRDLSPELADSFRKYLATIVLQAYSMAGYVNRPSSCIVKVGAERGAPAPGKGPPKIVPDYQRDTYTVLTPTEVRERWESSRTGAGGAEKMPHLRRGHFVTLQSERFSEEKRGSRIWRRAAAIHGASIEWTMGARKYRVV